MAIQLVPAFLQNASHSAALFRQSASSPYHLGGVLAAGEMAITQQSTPNMSVILGAGRAKVTGNSVSSPAGVNFTTQALYDVLNDAPATLTIATSDPVNPRYDLVYLGVKDAFYTGALNQAVALIATGVAAASPVVPSLPLNSNAIGLIVVAANATTIVAANINPYGYPASLRGAIVVAPSISFYPPVSFLGQYLDDPAVGLLRYNGSSWNQITDRYLELTRASSFTMSANSTTYILGGAGATNPFWNVPTASNALANTSTYNNELYSWGLSTGQLTIKVAGTYEIELNVSATLSGSGGSATIGIVKNGTTIGSTTNDLARCDGPLTTAAYLKARHPGVALGAGDVLYLLALMSGVTGTVVLGANPMDGTFRIRRLGV